MARAIIALALVAMAAGAAAAPFASPAPLPSTWVVRGDAAADTAIKATIALKRVNMDTLEATALAVSDPTNARYTEYLSAAEIARMTSDPAAVAAVSEWLTAAGVAFTVAPTGASVAIEATTAELSTLLDTTFTVVHNAETRQKATRAGPITLPASVAEHVEAVFGIHGLPLPPRSVPKVTAPDDDNAGAPVNVIPSVITTAYGIKGVNATGDLANRQAIAEFQGQLLSQSDLTQFFQSYIHGVHASQDKVYKYVGDQQQGEGVEANLDVQYIMGVAPGVKTEAWQYAGQDFCGDLKQWTQQILSTSNPPNVFSVSYGWQGDMSQIGCSTQQITSIDDDFKSIAAQGVGIIFASGDSGSAYDGQRCYASWPASSIWVTAVGATRFEGQDTSRPEMAVDQFGSGGGFSEIITPAPAFQKDAIASFYNNEPASSLPPKSDYGFGGRGTPDVAALGEGFQVVIGGSVESVGGTSASAPTFTAMVSLVNEALHQAGKKPMGNLNAFIYQNADVFTDIVKGSDRISRQGTQVTEGFDAVKGWDPVTGFGTMKFTAFLDAAKKAQNA